MGAANLCIFKLSITYALVNLLMAFSWIFLLVFETFCYFLFSAFHVYLFACMVGVCTQEPEHLLRSEGNLLELDLFFHCASGNGAEIRVASPPHT